MGRGRVTRPLSASETMSDMNRTSQISPPPVSAAQAAAIAAAIERFTRATARPASPVEEPPDHWIRAAILEGVERDPEQVFPASG
jgi:hypothetical protein